MLTLDHIVVHIEDSYETKLKAELDEVGIPFQPDWGKKAKGFKVSNIWVGQQYFEIVTILDRDNLWQPQWSARHARGDRGIYCLFFKTTKDVQQLHETFLNQGIEATEPERTRFKWMFGLLEKKLPWQFMLLPKVPGTPVELGIIQYDKGAEKKYEPFMVPNAKDEGVIGLEKAKIYSGNKAEALTYLDHVNQVVDQQMPIQLAEASEATQAIAVELTAKLAPNAKFSGFSVANVTVST